MRAIPISDGITWVGAIDWNLRDFHGYETPRGTTYNAYLVRGDGLTALVDTVKTPFVPEMLSRIAEVCDPAEIGLVVVNHVEPDHNSGLRLALEAMPHARVVASSAGVLGIAEYHDGLAADPVGKDDVIDLGGRTLRFLPVPMVHWPDSMFTWCAESSTLLPNDGFGQHLATAERFADEVGLHLALSEAHTYFANILTPVGAQVAKAVAKVGESGWSPAVVAPSHGVVWRGTELAAVLDAYAAWTASRRRVKTVVAYATMWGSTDTLARTIADAVASEGVEVELFDLGVTGYARVTDSLMDARGLLIGSPTLHHGMLHRVAGYLQYLAGLKPPGVMVAAFGSYGWSGGACEQIAERLGQAGIEMVSEPFTQKYRPNAEELAAAAEWGRVFARSIKAAQGA